MVSKRELEDDNSALESIKKVLDRFPALKQRVMHKIDELRLEKDMTVSVTKKAQHESKRANHKTSK